MILVDINVLVYAHVRDLPQHRTAKAWLDRQLGGTDAVGLPWSSVIGFLRIVTNPRIFPRPEPMANAWRQAAEWLACAPAWIPQPTDRHGEILGQLLAVPGVRGNLVPDAHLASLALEHGLTLCSTDGDFARFPGLRWLNPLAA
jgi:hypothetical protein